MRYGARLPLIMLGAFAIATPVLANHFDGAPELHEIAAYGSRHLGTEETIARAERLIAEGADVNQRAAVWGFTALHMAAVYGDEAIAELLIANGADVDARTDAGETPLHLTTLAGPDLVVRIYGHDPSPTDSPARRAARFAVAKLLIAHGADVNARQGNNATPLHMAIVHANNPAAELLVTSGADVHATTHGETPLDMAEALQDAWPFADGALERLAESGSWATATEFKKSLEQNVQLLRAPSPAPSPALTDVYNRFSELYAENPYQEALPFAEKALSLGEPFLTILAEVYSSQGRYAEAEPLYQRSLAIREKALGPEHPSVAIALGNLGKLYRAQGNWSEAEPPLDRALAILERSLGPENRHVATTLNILAELYRDQGRYAEAEPLYQRALSIYEKALGPEHPNVATSLENYAALLRKVGREAEAAGMEARAEAIRAKLAEANP